MKFGEAIEKCRAGALIRRSGWNGKNQFVYWQEGSRVPFCRLRCEALKQYLVASAGKPTPFNMNDVTIMGHFDIFTEQKVVQCGWLASQGDMQADDWEVLGAAMEQDKITLEG
jgi:hypothetical protein